MKINHPRDDRRGAIRTAWVLALALSLIGPALRPSFGQPPPSNGTAEGTAGSDPSEPTATPRFPEAASNLSDLSTETLAGGPVLVGIADGRIVEAYSLAPFMDGDPRVAEAGDTALTDGQSLSFLPGTDLRVTALPGSRRLSFEPEEVERGVRRLLWSGDFVPQPGRQFAVIDSVVLGPGVRAVASAEVLRGAPDELMRRLAASGAEIETSGDRLEITFRFDAEQRGAAEGVLSYHAAPVEFSRGATGAPRPRIGRGSVQLPPTTANLDLRESGRVFLPTGRSETQAANTGALGLYTYLLFHSPPTPGVDAQRKAYLAAIQAFFDRLSSIDSLLPHMAPETLNAIFLPLIQEPGSRPDAEWLLSHYDYSRARAYLSRFQCRAGEEAALESCGDWSRGPYLISSWKPLSAVDEAGPPALFQDWSDKPADVVGLWMESYLSWVRTENFGAEESDARLALRVRTRLSQVAQTVEPLRKAQAEVARLAEDLTGYVAVAERLIGLVWRKKDPQKPDSGSVPEEPRP